MRCGCIAVRITCLIGWRVFRRANRRFATWKRAPDGDGLQSGEPGVFPSSAVEMGSEAGALRGREWEGGMAWARVSETVGVELKREVLRAACCVLRVKECGAIPDLTHLTF